MTRVHSWVDTPPTLSISSWAVEVSSAFRSNVGWVEPKASPTKPEYQPDSTRSFAGSWRDGLAETDRGDVKPWADASGILVWWGSPEARPTLRSDSDVGGQGIFGKADKASRGFLNVRAEAGARASDHSPFIKDCTDGQ